MNTRMKWFNSITFIVFVVFAVLGAAEEKRNDIEAASLDYVDEPEPIRPSRPGLMITIRRHWVEFAGVALVTAIVCVNQAPFCLFKGLICLTRHRCFQIILGQI
jgi:hypothetical protein